MKFLIMSLSPLQARVSQQRFDILILALLVIEASLISYAGSHLIDPVILQEYTEDVWFGSDIGRVFGNMTDQSSDFFRAKVHPLFPILIYPLVYCVRILLNTTPGMAVRVVLALTTALWAGTVFITLRNLGCRRFDAALFSVLMLSSAASIFWTVVPETFLFGSLTMTIALCFTAIAQHQKFSQWWYVLVSAITLSITTTNWIIGMLMTGVNHSWKRSLWITIVALGLTTIVWRIQHRFFPSALFFIGNFEEEKHYFLLSTSGGPLRVLTSFVLHTMVMPAIQLLPSNRNQPEWPMLSTQFALPGSSGIWGLLATVLWIGLLGLGLWAFLTTPKNIKFRIVLGLGLLMQLVLYVVYGEETFLYATHIIPFLIGLCALTTLTRFRIAGLIITALLIVNVSINNSIQFAAATQFLKNTGPLREQSVSLNAQPHPLSVQNLVSSYNSQ
jgi:hypothetical protein